MSSPHALVFPFPAQSHIISLLELSYCLVDHGFKITFLNTEVNHRRLLAALAKESGSTGDLIITGGIRFASIPDGLGPGEDRNDLGRLAEGMLAVMPDCLEELMVADAGAPSEKFTCFVADESMAWAFDVAKKVGLRSAAFFPAAAGILAINFSIPKLIEDGVIDEQGAPMQKEMFRLGPDMTPMNPAHLCWNCFDDTKTQKIIFEYTVNNNRAVEYAELIICNSFHDLEKPVFDHTPSILPVGPMLSGSRPDRPVGSFWLQDESCIDWLDEQPAGSVVYVAFGSFTILNPIQVEELTAGLGLSGRPFLWAARPDLAANGSDINSSSFILNGRVVGWCPQQKVLSHPAIACFVSHCGWNSTLEGVRNGVPILCWPYFCDQFFNESYICDVWGIGLRMKADEKGIYRREEIGSKVEELVGDVGIRERCAAMKKMAAGSLEKGGSSLENLTTLAYAMKGGMSIGSVLLELVISVHTAMSSMDCWIARSFGSHIQRRFLHSCLPFALLDMTYGWPVYQSLAGVVCSGISQIESCSSLVLHRGSIYSLWSLDLHA